MAPAKPPLPAPWNLPFQWEAGIQTSNWILESADGLMTPATRQKAGRLGKALPTGGVKLPAATDSALVIEVAGRSSLLRVSQVWAAGAADASAMQAATASTARVVRDRDGEVIDGRLLLNIDQSAAHPRRHFRAATSEPRLPSRDRKGAVPAEAPRNSGLLA